MYEYELTYEIDGKRNHIEIVHVKKHHLTKSMRRLDKRRIMP
jgi:hypothetical protein